MLHGFPKSNHLRKSWEYQRVWKVGCKIHTPHFILLVAENSMGVSRLGLTVSRKVGNAVVRNSVKRLLREFFRLTKVEFVADVDFSVVAKRGANSLSLTALTAEIKNALEIKGHLSG